MLRPRQEGPQNESPNQTVNARGESSITLTTKGCLNDDPAEPAIPLSPDVLCPKCFDDVRISAVALPARHFSRPLPVYRLNNNMLVHNLRHNLTDGQGGLLEYTLGAPVITDLAAMRAVLANHRDTWPVTERIRFYHPTPTPVAIQRFIKSACQLQTFAAVPDMMVWYCGRSTAASSRPPDQPCGPARMRRWRRRDSE